MHCIRLCIQNVSRRWQKSIDAAETGDCVLGCRGHGETQRLPESIQHQLKRGPVSIYPLSASVWESSARSGLNNFTPCQSMCACARNSSKESDFPEKVEAKQPHGISPGGRNSLAWGSITCKRWTLDPNRRAMRCAQLTAGPEVLEKSVAIRMLFHETSVKIWAEVISEPRHTARLPTANPYPRYFSGVVYGEAHLGSFLVRLLPGEPYNHAFVQRSAKRAKRHWRVSTTVASYHWKSSR